MDSELEITVYSTLSNEGDRVVATDFGNGEYTVLLSPGDARDYAKLLLGCVEALETVH